MLSEGLLGVILKRSTGLYRSPSDEIGLNSFDNFKPRDSYRKDWSIKHDVLAI